MYEISCEMCEDLMPLVEDGVAGKDSREAVEHHVRTCPKCIRQYTGEQPPAGDEKKAVSRLMSRLQIVGFLLLAAGALVGIFMTERIMRGLSVLFALVVFLIGWMLRWAMTRSGTVKGRGLRVAVRVLAFALSAVVLLSANLLIGNPISQLLAQEAADAYLAKHYPNENYQVRRVTYNFLDGDYYAVITSESSVDGSFELYVDMLGNVYWDSYDMYVTSGKNTQDRLYSEYRDLVDPIIKLLNLETSVHIGGGRLMIDEVLLEVDGEYDIAALGAEQGHLIVTVRDEAVTVERAAELLKLIDELMTEHGGTFYSIDLSIWPPAAEVPTDEPRTTLELDGFLREDISGEGLVERIRETAVFRTN